MEISVRRTIDGWSLMAPLMGVLFHTHRRIGLARAACLSAASASASTTSQTPEQLTKDLVAAGQAGDVDRFLALLTPDSRKALTDSFANQASLAKAQQEFQQALDMKFGEGTTTLSEPPDDLTTAIGRLVEVEVLGKKPGSRGEVQLQVKTSVKTMGGKLVSREDTLTTRQERGGWKLASGFAPDRAPAAERLAVAQRITWA
jgi:hypothetical protein